MDSRLFHFIKKEFIQFFRDPRMFGVALFAPMIQLIFLGYVASTDIKHVSTAILDQDKSYYSRSYLQSFKNSGYFDFNYYVKDLKEITILLDNGQAKLALDIPRDFGKKIARGETAAPLAIIDGSNSSTASIIVGYISQINFSNSNAIFQHRLSNLGLTFNNTNTINSNLRIWYNPELKSSYYMVPAIFAQILMIISMMLTSASIVKEKEKGTIEMLIVTPLKPYELILGKLIPPVIIAFFDIALVFLITTLWFGVPMKGSIFLLFALGMSFSMTGLGIGLFVSTISQTQRQALMVNNFIMMPSFILSGFVFPISNMPQLVQIITYFIPLRYFLSILRGLFLKGVGMQYLWTDTWPLLVFGTTILTLSILRFKKKIG